MQETRKSLILHLTKENWQQELQDANISDLAKEKLRSALNVKLNGMGKMPSITEGQFNKIVKQEVFFVKVGKRNFLLSFKKGLMFLKNED